MPVANGAAAEARTVLLVVCGIGGEPEYSERFAGWCEAMLEAAEGPLAIPREHVQYLSESTSVRADGRSVKSELVQAIARMAAQSEPGDVAMIFLVGHGTARHDDTLFNLPGPDLGAGELAGLLEALDGRRQVVVVGASASSGFISALSAPGRVVVTATASATERFLSVFPEHFVAAFAGPGADTDKDERVSLAEAFIYASREVARSYAADGRLQTEHALLDDDGDGRGSRELAASGGDGALAAALHLDAASVLATSSAAPETTRRWLRERERLVAEIESLKSRKSELDADAYALRLEALLVDLALVHRALRGAPSTR